MPSLAANESDIGRNVAKCTAMHHMQHISTTPSVCTTTALLNCIDYDQQTISATVNNL